MSSNNKNKEIGNRIKQAREKKGITLQDVADIVGVAKSTIQRYESGSISKLKLPVIESISNALDVSPLWITLKSDSIHDTEQKNKLEHLKILEHYDKLNQNGKQEAEKRIEELTHIDKYTNTYRGEILNAAHEIPGATEEEKQHDEDIMNDENF